MISNILSYLPLQSPKKGLNWIINFRAKFNSSWNSMTSSNKFVFWPYFWRHGGLLIWLYHPIAQKSKFGICHPRGGTFLVRRCVKWYTYFICAGMGQTRLWQGSSTCEITGSATFAMDSKQWIITSFTIRIIAWTLVLTFCCRASKSNNCLFVTQFKMQIQTW